MKLILLRHGRTEGNEKRLYCGHTDVSLSENGRAELLALRAEGGYPSAEGYEKITSGLRRANETLEMLYDCKPDRILPDWREMDFGRFSMHSYEELKADADYQAWITDETGMVSTPGGECEQQFRARVLRGWQSIDRDALAVCHGGVIAMLMAYWFPEMKRNRYQWQTDSGRGYFLEFTPEGRSFHEIPE